MATLPDAQEPHEQPDDADTSIVVRRATEHDRVAALGLIAPSASRGRASLALLRAGQGMLWVAVEETDTQQPQGAPANSTETSASAEKLVGLLLATAQIDPATEELVGYIHELLVHPAYRRRGVAMSLLDAAERTLLVEGEFSLVYVVTSFENDAAVRLYRSRGYSLSQARFVRRRNSRTHADQPDDESRFL